MFNLIKVGIVGATGYTGVELVRILSRHPEVQLVALTSRSYAGQPYYRAYPHLYQYTDLICTELDIDELAANTDVVFTALPHGHSMDIAAAMLQRNKKVVDLGADFRLDDHHQYQQWYQVEHSAPELLSQGVYGLTEINRQKIAQTNLVANPGCYPTTAILGLAPLLKHNVIDPQNIIIDSKSGVSGAGRGLSLKTHYCETNDNLQAYGVTTHRHTPEIEQELSKLAGCDVQVNFTPHLIPMTRGMLSTIYVNLKEKFTFEQLQQLYSQFYQKDYFIKLLPAGMLPQTKAVAGSNFCQIALVPDQRTGRLIILVAIDNLLKGAAGQAIQNMNVMFGLDEKTGLDMPALYP